MELLFAALYLVAIAALARRRMWPEVTYVGLTAAALLTSSFYQSVPRSMLVAFPVFVPLAQWTSTTRHRIVVAAAVLASAAILTVNTACFVRGCFAG
jgi:hypothetical protein